MADQPTIKIRDVELVLDGPSSPGTMEKLALPQSKATAPQTECLITDEMVEAGLVALRDRSFLGLSRADAKALTREIIQRAWRAGPWSAPRREP